MELNEQKAKDIDDILQFSLAHGFLKGFDVRYYNNHTKEFLESGGFQKIYEIEQKQELKETIDLKLAQKTLRTYRVTQILAWAGFIIGLGLAILEVIKFFNEMK